MSGSALLRTIVASQLWVGLGAGAQVLGVSAAFGQPGSKDLDCWYAAALAAAVASYYAWYRGAAPYSNAGYTLLWICTAVLAALSLRGQTLLYCVLGAVLPLAYGLLGKRYRSSWAFGYCKTLLLAVAWTYYTAYVPSSTAASVEAPLIASRFAFFLSLALAFDYRDVEVDKRAGVRTLAAYSRKPLLVASVVLMLASVALQLLGGSQDNLLAQYALVFSSGIALPLLPWAFRQNRPAVLAYELLLDGLLILPLPIYLTLVAFS